MKVTQDYYAILGVSPNAEVDDINAAYRAIERRFNPNANANPGAAIHYQDSVEAFEILGDEYSRVEYDRILERDGLPPAYFNLRLTASKTSLRMMKEPQVLYMLVEITPDNRFAQKHAEEAPLNLALVIDRSTSMRGTRLDKVKQAVHRIIDSLGPQDKISLVSFSDRADLVIETTPVLEKATLKAMASTMQASGGTEILQGMTLGAKQLQKSLDHSFVNHLILLTDGQTYGDEEQCLQLADQLQNQGISISAIGIGEEWNDEFLDDLASRTGGTSEYINSPSAVEQFLNKHVRSLGAAFIERLSLSIAPDSNIRLEDAFKLSPTAQPLPINVSNIALGSLERQKSISILLQLQVESLIKTGFASILRISASGDILRENHQNYKTVSDFSIEVVEDSSPQNPPAPILEALGKLTLYRMQAKAQEALARGNYREATRRLENLATRLLENGEAPLAHAALAEARRVARTTMLSEEGQKRLKYGTRALLPGRTPSDDTTQIIDGTDE